MPLTRSVEFDVRGFPHSRQNDWDTAATHPDGGSRGFLWHVVKRGPE